MNKEILVFLIAKSHIAKCVKISRLVLAVLNLSFKVMIILNASANKLLLNKMDNASVKMVQNNMEDLVLNVPSNTAVSVLLQKSVVIVLMISILRAEPVNVYQILLLSMKNVLNVILIFVLNVRPKMFVHNVWEILSLSHKIWMEKMHLYVDVHRLMNK